MAPEETFALLCGPAVCQLADAEGDCVCVHVCVSVCTDCLSGGKD